MYEVEDKILQRFGGKSVGHGGKSIAAFSNTSDYDAYMFAVL